MNSPPKEILQEYDREIRFSSATTAKKEKSLEAFNGRYAGHEVAWPVRIHDIVKDEDGDFVIHGWWLEVSKGWLSTTKKRTRILVVGVGKAGLDPSDFDEGADCEMSGVIAKIWHDGTEYQLPDEDEPSIAHLTIGMADASIRVLP